LWGTSQQTGKRDGTFVRAHLVASPIDGNFHIPQMKDRCNHIEQLALRAWLNAQERKALCNVVIRGTVGSDISAATRRQRVIDPQVKVEPGSKRRCVRSTPHAGGN
jgi:hypothetical protein